MKKLLTGAAYHGNRMLHHAEADMFDMARNHMNLVVHMFSHTDWERHCRVMRDMVAISEDAGLEVWIDNWGLGGPPGDKSHVLALYPSAHQYYSDGEMLPSHACLNSPDFRKFIHEWVDAVAYIGGKTIFWDEPHIPMKNDGTFACACPTCRKKFEIMFNKPMPDKIDADVEEFRTATIVDYMQDVCDYAASKGIKNTVCVMLGQNIGINLDTIDRLCSIPTLDNIGSDPYWVHGDKSAYEYVYTGAKKNIEIANRFGKDHNIWIQAFDNPRGSEEEIVQATEAAYDAGARTIIAWGYYGSISNDYSAKNPHMAAAKINEAFARIWEFERDRILAENRKKYMK